MHHWKLRGWKIQEKHRSFSGNTHKLFRKYKQAFQEIHKLFRKYTQAFQGIHGGFSGNTQKFFRVTLRSVTEALLLLAETCQMWRWNNSNFCQNLLHFHIHHSYFVPHIYMKIYMIMMIVVLKWNTQTLSGTTLNYILQTNCQKDIWDLKWPPCCPIYIKAATTYFFDFVLYSRTV